MPRPSAVRYTYEDYLAVPVGAPGRHEIVDGELFVTAAPRYRHQKVVANLVRILADLGDQHGLGEVVPGPVTVHIHDELVLEPDVVFVARDRLHIVDPEGAIHGPPDLIVEVLSPSKRSYDRTLKRKHYMENGLTELWLVDADERTVEIWRAGEGEAETVGDWIGWMVGERGYRVMLDDIFRA